MSSISNINSSLLQSQLENLQLRQTINVKVASKTLDVARDQGAAVLQLLDQATDLAQTAPQSALTYGALVSGLGQNLDLTA